MGRFAFPRRLRRFHPTELDARMREAGLNTSQLGALVGVSRQTVESWLRGKTEPKGGNLVNVADVLGCEARDLTTLE